MKKIVSKRKEVEEKKKGPDDLTNESLLKLLELIKIYNGGISPWLEDTFEAFSYLGDYQIETIDDLIEAMEIELSYCDE